MKKLEKIAQNMAALPTIMSIEDEIDIILDLMTLSSEEICSDRKIFEEILDDISISHCDSGYYGLTRENEGHFKKFCEWLAHINKVTGFDFVEGGLEKTYDDLVAEFGEECLKQMPKRPRYNTSPQ